MKKIVFLFMASIAMTFASCNSANKGEETVSEADSTIVSVDSTVVAEADSLVESAVVDSALVAE